MNENKDLSNMSKNNNFNINEYHPCIWILIRGLKDLHAYDVLREWDRARMEIDKKL